VHLSPVVGPAVQFVEDRQTSLLHTLPLIVADAVRRPATAVLMSSSRSRGA
jgi:hypothetical protein